MLLLVLIEFILLLIGGAVVLWALAYLLSDHTDVPFVRTHATYFPAIASALNLGDDDTLIELGAGDGGFVRWCAARFPAARFVGVERNPMLYHIAAWRGRRFANLTFIRGDLFETDLSGATKLYAFLLPAVMDRLQPQLQHFQGTLASRAFRISARAPEATVELSTRPGRYGQHLLHLYHF